MPGRRDRPPRRGARAPRRQRARGSRCGRARARWRRRPRVPRRARAAARRSWFGCRPGRRHDEAASGGRARLVELGASPMQVDPAPPWARAVALDAGRRPRPGTSSVPRATSTPVRAGIATMRAPTSAAMRALFARNPLAGARNSGHPISPGARAQSWAVAQKGSRSRRILRFASEPHHKCMGEAADGGRTLRPVVHGPSAFVDDAEGVGAVEIVGGTRGRSPLAVERAAVTAQHHGRRGAAQRSPSRPLLLKSVSTALAVHSRRAWRRDARPRPGSRHRR